jgi:predicted TIM-barrel fold metal-dependent hydrolase
VHTHVRVKETTGQFFEAARQYGVDRIVTMSPLEEVDPLRERYPDALRFIAVPRFREFDVSDAYRAQWLRDLAAFRERGAGVMKFWMAPPMRGKHGLTLEHAFLQPVIKEALDLGYDFMTHIADPSAWFEREDKYADGQKYGTKRDQYPQLEWLLDHVAPRFVIGAHMGGTVEDLDFLQGLLDRHDNYYIDSSATKWIVRGIAGQPERAREFFIHNADRILFGTDLVVDDKFDFDHYASRFWVHQIMWETDYRGESPIVDPDAGDRPMLAGLNLPDDVLRRMYWENAERLGLRADREK